VYKFEDRIAATTANNILSADYANFVAAGNSNDATCAGCDTNGNGIADAVEAWVNGPNSDPGIQRDPVTYLVTRVQTRYLNAQSMKNRALDVYARYNLSLNRWGDFTFNLAATKALEYSYDLGTPGTSDSGDGVGKQNEQVAEIPPMPEWRVNAGINWFLGNQAATIRARWFSSVQMEFNTSFFLDVQKALNGTDKLKSITYVDANYKYTFPKLLGDRETTVEVGANNLFDQLPPPIVNLGGIESFLYDVRGRMIYFRIHQDL
jgi:hypothetical protein